MRGNKVQSANELAIASLHAEKGADVGDGEEGLEHQIRDRQHRRHDIQPTHHLLARVGAKGLVNVVLGGICQSVEEEVHAQQRETDGAAAFGFAGGFFRRARVVQGEDCHAGGYQQHDQVFVPRVAPAEQRDVQKHDGEQLAGFREREGDVVDVFQARVAKGGCQGRGQRYH